LKLAADKLVNQLKAKDENTAELKVSERASLFLKTSMFAMKCAKS